MHVARKSDSDTYIISCLDRYKSNGYLGTKDNQTFEIPLTSSDNEIGKAIAKAFNYCL
ncbi:contact-dependent growth inhibition system immunity protein [Paenibacillus cremeus]|uniref:DUF1436 family protein n=1 Tax=Paenibacillus cremeus TaxID=2163881 RepID=A0A559K0D8_9BACL|nr:DUF1436 family protein [Paenibacillus cremeus]